eukprot:scaffold23278_cov59-Phaeocystis_antarctica.AAC.4
MDCRGRAARTCCARTCGAGRNRLYASPLTLTLPLPLTRQWRVLGYALFHVFYVVMHIQPSP